MDVVADAVLVEQLVELLVIDAMRALHFPVEVRRPGTDVDVPNVQRLEVPVELGLKLGAVIRLRHVHAERQAAQHLVDEQDGGALVARIVDLQDSNSGAIIDGRELIQPASRTWDSLQKLHIELQSVAWLWLFIPLPALPVWLMLLIRRQAIHPMPLEDAVYRGARDLDAMEPVHVRRDPGRSEVIVLAQVEDLADHLASRRAGRSLRRPRPIAQAGITVLGLSALPLVERFPGYAEPAAGSGDILLRCRVL